MPGPRQPRTLLHSRAARAAALAPVSVSAGSWELFILEVDMVRHGGTFTGGALRQAVRLVVGEMRAASEPWEAVYGVLGSAVSEAPTAQVEYSVEHDTHASRAAALVAHMHSWADCVRLDELNEVERRGTEDEG
jgi:hypothetical protein